ncbi:redoxin domain-containing protein [Polluticaenibacter yanchengensis]|uniref:TlpA disulfide reductase family protein n=1 Tax=Polluticaenibacter yanchengensis TaxID=3014562 RepID=A0ABT4UJE8_9BACT|nr:TlpA disulfide reductase family protein [Chitinophagaceae bacterium LY-5]
MKKTLLVFASSLLLFACKNDDKDNSEKKSDSKISSGKLTIKGTVEGMEDGVLELFLIDKDDVVPDTIKVKGGKFDFSKEISEPVHSVLREVGHPDESLVFFADPGEVKITTNKDSFYVGKIEAGASQKQFKELNDKIKVIMEPAQKISEAYMQAQQSNDQVAMERIVSEFDSLQSKVVTVVNTFAKENNNSIVTPFMVLNLSSQNPKNLEIVNISNAMSDGLKGTFYGKKLAEMADKEAKTTIGAIAPDFTQEDPNGKSIALSSFRGKYVLVDFWASWCGPCRQENPNVVDAYNKYKGKNFTVFGVSLDKSKDAWTKAIMEDKLAWEHVSDLQYWNNAAARLYGIQAIPANFLIDPQGKIIAKNITGKELHNKLAEVLK